MCRRPYLDLSPSSDSFPQFLFIPHPQRFPRVGYESDSDDVESPLELTTSVLVTITIGVMKLHD